MLHIEQILLILRVHGIQDVDTVLMSTLLICDTVIVDLSNVRVYFIRICMYIYIKQVLSSGNSLNVKTVNFNS